MVDAADTPVIAILTRAPSAGGKTRLFASLGLKSDPALLTALLLDTLDGTAASGVRRVVAVTPPDACGEVRTLVGDIDVIPQPSGDLGERMRAVMTTLFARGASAVALIGSDVPHVTPATVAAAFALIAHDPRALVLGPATDGGYYLIAAAELPEVFSGIEWGTSSVCELTELAAAAAGLHVHRLPEMTDVDTADALNEVTRSGLAQRTAAWAARSGRV